MQTFVILIFTLLISACSGETERLERENDHLRFYIYQLEKSLSEAQAAAVAREDDYSRLLRSSAEEKIQEFIKLKKFKYCDFYISFECDQGNINPTQISTIQNGNFSPSIEFQIDDFLIMILEFGSKSLKIATLATIISIIMAIIGWTLYTRMSTASTLSNMENLHNKLIETQEQDNQNLIESIKFSYEEKEKKWESTKKVREQEARDASSKIASLENEIINRRNEIDQLDTEMRSRKKELAEMDDIANFKSTAPFYVNLDAHSKYHQRSSKSSSG